MPKPDEPKSNRQANSLVVGKIIKMSSRFAFFLEKKVLQISRPMRKTEIVFMQRQRGLECFASDGIGKIYIMS